MICSSCGATTPAGTAFCGSCGRPIVGYSVGGSSAAVAAAGAVAPPGSTLASAGSSRYAGFWLRFAAAIIDSLIIGIPFGVIMFMMIVSTIPRLTNIRNPAEMVALILPHIFFILLLSLVGSWLYWALMESSSWQATLGKKALGLYVTDLEGKRATFGRTSGRFFAGRGIGAVPSIGGLYFLVDCIMAGFTENKQALHDMMASCLVMRSS